MDEAGEFVDALRADHDSRRAISKSFRAVPQLLAFTNDVFAEIEKDKTRRDAFRFEEQDRFPIEVLVPPADALGIVAALSVSNLLRGMLFGVLDLSRILTMYYVVLAVFVLGFLFIYRVIHSPFGQVLKAIRENEPRTVSLGYDADRYKLLAFVLSATLSGVAGATSALVFQLAALNAVYWTMSGEVVLMTLVGGMGTIFGPVVGALVVLAMENYLAQLGAWVTIVQGLVFVVCVLTFRRGIAGERSPEHFPAPVHFDIGPEAADPDGGVFQPAHFDGAGQRGVDHARARCQTSTARSTRS